MALEQQLRMKLSQRLVMTPSLQQAIKLLLLSRIELEQTLSQEILANPMLEVEAEDEELQELSKPEEGSDESGEGGEALGTSDDAGEALPTEEESYGDIDVEAFFADYVGGSPTEGASSIGSDDHRDPIETMLAASSGLYDHLIWQLHLANCSREVADVGEFIIGNLDENGFIQVNDEEIAQATGADLTTVQHAMSVVRSLDPPGIGARNTQEALLLQVDYLIQEASPDENERELLHLAEKLISEHWDDLLHQRWNEISKALSLDRPGLQALVDVIRRLELKPGQKYGTERNVFVEPDVYVRKVGNEYKIFLNDDGMPRLRMSSRYLRLLQSGTLDRNASAYLKDKMKNAVWLMKSIDQRQRTIYKVAESIVRFQRGFLDHGIEALRPMVLRQVAEDIGMHESTVSRVVTNKYMSTPQGLYPMKFFFHSGVDSARGENVSSLVVKERIRKMIQEEDPAKPLSDSAIMKMLQREGIRLARRTVAKYREELGLLSSDKRKRAL